MKNLWPQSFQEPDFEKPRSIFEQQAKLLPTLTGDLVYAEVTELSLERAHFDSISDDFAYGFYITSRLLANYSFKILSFSHDVEMYPVKLNINSEIRRELNIKHVLVEVKSPQELESLLEKILTSDKISKTIGAIIKMSK